jgi:protoheme IX farnesyltransferase
VKDAAIDRRIGLQPDPVRLKADATLARVIADYVALTKPRLNVLVVASSAAGYYLGAQTPTDLSVMAHAVIGTTLVAGGSAALNQVAERDTDAKMRRTRMRPLPDGRISPAEGRLFGIVLSVAGLGILAGRANLLSALLAFATLLIYLVIYTPMKRRTSAATLLGAVPGALPPLIGWAASHGRVDAGGAVLFAIVFLWQIPHFMAIAWLYRHDYGAAGFPMLPVIDPGGVRAARQALIYAVLLVPVSLLPSLVGVAGNVYLAAAIPLGLAMVWLAVRFNAARNDATARALFFASITYLPLLWIVMVIDKA